MMKIISLKFPTVTEKINRPVRVGEPTYLSVLAEANSEIQVTDSLADVGQPHHPSARIAPDNLFMTALDSVWE